jgi:hypothetical protein
VDQGCAILKGVKLLVQIFLLTALAGCASPYRTVYTSPEGDYYIEERAAQSAYYVPDSVMYAGIGFDPWWIIANPSLSFIYYNPGYYQYYLAAWYDLMYPSYYGYYGRYYSNWCPPFRVHHGHLSPGSNSIADSSIPAPFIDSRQMTTRKDLWRPPGNKHSDRPIKPGDMAAYKSMGQPRSMSSFMNAPGNPSISTTGISNSRSVGMGSPSFGSPPVDRGNKMSGSLRGRDKQ